MSEIDSRGNPQPLTGGIKDELLLLSSLVLFVGLVSTEAYYSYFSVRYQLLGLPSSHVIYRGLTVLIDAPYLLVPYLAAAIWLWLSNHAKLDGRHRWHRLRGPLAYALIVCVPGITYPLARHAGVAQARADLRAAGSSLPRVLTMEVSRNGGNLHVYGDEDRLRLLLTTPDHVIVFPLPENSNQIPVIRRFLKGDVHVIETEARTR